MQASAGQSTSASASSVSPGEAPEPPEHGHEQHSFPSTVAAAYDCEPSAGHQASAQQTQRARQSSSPAEVFASREQRSLAAHDDGNPAPADRHQQPRGDGDRSRSVSRPSTAASHHSSQAPFEFANHAERPPSAHSSGSTPHSHPPKQQPPPHRDYNPDYNPKTPQQHSHQQPSLFSAPPTSPLSNQSFSSATPRAPPGSLERPNGSSRSTASTGDESRSSGDQYSSTSSDPSSRQGGAPRGFTEAALGYDSLLGPAPSSSSAFIFDPRARGSSPGGERTFGAAFDSRGGSMASSESGSSQAHLRGYDQASPRSAEATLYGGNSHDFGGLLAQTGHSNGPFSSQPLSSPSFSSSAALVSPLSPHVEPFSPSSANGGSWGSGGGKAFNGQQTLNNFGNGSHDLRAFSTQQPSSGGPFARSSLPSFSPDPGAFNTYNLHQQPHVQSDRDRDRKFSLPLNGVPEHGYPTSPHGQSLPLALPPNNYEVPGLPPLNTSLAPLQNYFGPSTIPINQYSSDQESGYGSVSTAGGNMYSTTMSASGSREGFAGAGLGLQPTRREIPTDRGGYVRASYSSETAARGLGVGAGSSSVAAPSVPGDGGNVEEISTIFVVGFPEDMLEREFQNMFVFSHGFEAATLKIPASTVAARERDRELATAAAVSAAVGNAGLKQQQQQQGPSSATLPSQTGTQSQTAYLDQYGGMLDGAAYEDAFGNLSLEGSGSLAQALGGLPGRDTAGSPAGTRKQIIGFAKFRTRSQALDARDTLSGKRVDAEKGCILKAEMAKKNLHTKRGLSNELAQGGLSFPLSSLDAATLGRLANATNLNPAVLAELARQSAAQQATQQTSERDPRDAFNSYSSQSGFAPRERETSGGGAYARSSVSGASREYYDDGPASPNPSGGTSAAYYSLPHPDSMRRAYSHDRQGGSNSSPPESFADPAHSPTASSSSVQTSSPHLRGAVLQSAYTGNSMHQQLDEGAFDGQRLNPPRTFASSQYGSDAGGYGSDRERTQPSFAQPLYPGFSQNSVNPSPIGGSRMGNLTGPTSPPMGPSHSGNGIPRTQNPADMNAPKNTLYVGGLPAVLPSLTGPFSAAHLEDSLRSAFCRCAGFRRLCFRSKSNGPIVFVEFDDVMFATQALQDMYGHTLGGLIKGGIRLSYSKNPLGVRSSNGGGPNGSPLPPLSDGTFYTPPMLRRPSESVFGPANPLSSMDYRPPIPRSPPAAPFQQFSNAAPTSFSPFSFDH